MRTSLNTRVLVIDDDEVVRDSIREVLLPKRRDTSGLEAAASALFDDDDDDETQPVGPSARTKSGGTGLDIELSEASGGMEALDKIREAVEANRPFAVIFLDMRMPGWDGLETAERIRKIDRAAEIAFVTAYSDYGIEEIVERAGLNVGFHCKPFAPEEIRQIATKGIYDWNKINNLKQLIEGMGRLRSDRAEVETLLQNVLNQVSDWVSTSSTLIAHVGEGFEYTPLVGCGRLGDPERAARLLRQLSGKPITNEMFRFEGNAHWSVSEGAMIAVWQDENRINPEKIYLLRLFVEHASQVVENAQLQEQLLQAEKLSALGQAIGNVSHDLRSPIGTIQSALDIIRGELDDRELVLEMLDIIGRSAENAMALVDDILDFTKHSAVEKRPFAVKELLEQVRRQTKNPLKEHRVALKTECDDGLLMLGDARKLERVLINLIVNAAEAMEPLSGLDPTVSLSARGGDGFAYLSVSDQGPGIPSRIIPTLFDPFVTQGKPNGTGLGLAIAKQIVEAHGGELTFTTGDTGTEFLVKIPR